MSLRNRRVDENEDSLVVSLEEFKEHIRWGQADDSEDGVMEMYIESATAQAEAFTARVFRTSSWQTLLDDFPSEVTLDITPVDASSVVVKYFDVDNTEQTLSSDEYFVHDNGIDEYIRIEFDGTIPNVYDKRNAVVIEYDAGYENIPELIKVAIMKRAAKNFQFRGDAQVPDGVDEFFKDLYQYKML